MGDRPYHAINPPLSAEQLADIRRRYEPRPDRTGHSSDQVWSDILKLMWDIKRYRARTLRAYQLRQYMKRPNDYMAPVYDEYVSDFDQEACVLEQRCLAEELTAGPGAARKVGPRTEGRSEDEVPGKAR